MDNHEDKQFKKGIIIAYVKVVSVSPQNFLESRCVMIEVPQNRDVLSEVGPGFLPNLQGGDEDRHIETTLAPQEERYFLEGPKSRSSEFHDVAHRA